MLLQQFNFTLHDTKHLLLFCNWLAESWTLNFWGILESQTWRFQKTQSYLQMINTYSSWPGTTWLIFDSGRREWIFFLQPPTSDGGWTWNQSLTYRLQSRESKCLSSLPQIPPDSIYSLTWRNFLKILVLDGNNDGKRRFYFFVKINGSMKSDHWP